MDQSSIAAAAPLFLAAIACAQPAQFQLNTVPDFAQYNNPQWRNYCAPTVGADWVYHFANASPALRQGNPVGPGAAADAGVNGLIGAAVNPAAGTLAQLMGTTPAGGTTLVGCANGLDAYLEANDGAAGNANWTTTPVWVNNFQNPSGQNFLNFLQQTLANGGGVILAIAWLNGVPGGYDVPDGYDPTNEAGPMGHAVAMTGYSMVAAPMISINDPADNLANPFPPPAHNWGGQNLAMLAGGLPNGLVLNFGGVQGTVYGAVVTIPSPAASAALLGIGGLAAVRRRRA